MTTETELRTQLQETGDSLTGPPTTFNQIVSRSARRRQQRRLTIAGVTAMVLLGVAGLATLGGGLLDDTDSNPNRIETVGDGQDSLPLPESTGPLLEWERLDEVEEEFRLATWHGEGTGASDDRFYATIMDDAGFGRLFTSTDGSEWFDLGELPFPLEDGSLVSGGGNLYALENIDQLLEGSGERVTPVWWSPDNAETWQKFGDWPGQSGLHVLDGNAVGSLTWFERASREAHFSLLRLDGPDALVLADMIDEIPPDHEYLVGWVSTRGRNIRYAIETFQPPISEDEDGVEGEWLVRESPDGIAWIEAEVWQPDDPALTAGPGGLITLPRDQIFGWSTDDQTWGWDTVTSAFGDQTTSAEFLIGRNLVLALVVDDTGGRRLFRAEIPEAEPGGTNGAAPEDDVSSEEASDSPEPPPQSPVEIAEAITELTGAGTVIQIDNQLTERQDIHVWTAGSASATLIPQASPRWADHNFIYSRTSNAEYQVFNHGGTMVCSTTIEGLSTDLHHATQRDDGSIVLAVSEWVADDNGSFTAFGWAQDCETGERVAIEPMYRDAGKTEYELLETVAGRTFTLSGDAEGNVSRIVDDSGRDIITDDDYVGISTFSRSGNILAYGEHRGSASPHWTGIVEVRDTRTSELLLSWRAPGNDIVCKVDLLGDELLAVVYGPWESASTGVCSHQHLAAIDITSGVELGAIELGEFDVLYIG